MATKLVIVYQVLHDELAEIVAVLQRDDTDIDEALQAYKRGLEIIKTLETYLQTAETTVTELQANFGNT